MILERKANAEEVQRMMLLGAQKILRKRGEHWILNVCDEFQVAKISQRRNSNTQKRRETCEASFEDLSGAVLCCEGFRHRAFECPSDAKARDGTWSLRSKGQNKGRGPSRHGICFNLPTRQGAMDVLELRERVVGEMILRHERGRIPAR